jgi:very-short-patch-repair endonuclease
MKTNRQLELERMLGEDLGEWIQREYVEKQRTTVDISEQLGIQRRTLTRYMNEFGIKRRNNAEDNKRRYQNMTNEQRNQQTSKANESVRKNGQPKKKGKPAAWVNSEKRQEIARKISLSKRGDQNPMTKETHREKASKSLVSEFRKRALPQEEVVCKHLDDRGVNYVYQYHVGRYVCDFAFLDKDLIIEIDTMDKWGKERRERSEIRDAYLNERGWKVIHLNKRHVFEDIKIIDKYI